MDASLGKLFYKPLRTEGVSEKGWCPTCDAAQKT